MDALWALMTSHLSLALKCKVKECCSNRVLPNRLRNADLSRPVCCRLQLVKCAAAAILRPKEWCLGSHNPCWLLCGFHCHHGRVPSRVVSRGFSLLPGPPTPQQPLGSSLADSSSWPSSPDLRTGRFSSGALKASALLVVTAWSASALLVAKAWNASATAAAAATARPSTASAASSAAFLLQGHCCS
jgi:hypothetical protein